MNGIDDNALLREYTDYGSEKAFKQVVEHHLGLVYSVALRRVGNPSLAEEVTQAVFIVLARKAPTLSKKTMLPSWLYQTTRLTANNALRQEIRRAHREQEAYMQTLSQDQRPDPWAISQLFLVDGDTGEVLFTGNPNDEEALSAAVQKAMSTKSRKN